MPTLGGSLNLLRILAQSRSFAGELEVTPAPETFNNSGDEKGNLSYLAISSGASKLQVNTKRKEKKANDETTTQRAGKRLGLGKLAAG